MLVDFPLSILIADDHELFRNAIRSILTDCSTKIQFSEAADGVECLSVLEKEQFNLVLLDINMPNMDGLECIQRIKERWPTQRVAILTQYEQAGFLKQMKEYGAEGYILKSATPSEIVDSVFSLVVADEQTFPVHVSSNLEQIEALLSIRELEVLQLISDGNKNHEIAQILGIAENTVSNYRCSLLQKLELRNTADLVKWTMKQGLTSKLEY